MKLVLHGGGDLTEEQRLRIVEELKKDLPEGPIVILVVPFGREQSEWGRVFEKYSNRYKELGVNGEFILASPDAITLDEQLKYADVVLVAGGDERLLRERLQRVEFSAFEGKTVVGVSAGANIFAAKYYSNDRGAIEDGMYKLPFNTICHYSGGSIQLPQRDLLMSYGETLALAEGEFAVINVK